MTPGGSRWLAPLGASAAVLALFVVPGVLTPPGSGGGGAGPGLLTPQDAPTSSLPADLAEQYRVGPHQVDVVGYRSVGRTLRVYYTLEQSADCSTQIQRPVVLEREGSVVIRLHRRRSPAPEEVCARLLLTNSLDIRLAAPLGDRVLQDGSRDGALVPVEPPYRSESGGLPTPPGGRAGR